MIKCALILCGGKGSRFGFRDKSLLQYEKTPIIEYLFKTLSRRKNITKIILVANESNYKIIDSLARKYFENVIVYRSQPTRFREAIRHVSKHLDEEFYLFTGNQPIEYNHLLKMENIHFKTKKWVVSLYHDTVSVENTKASLTQDLKININGTNHFVIQHPFILSKSIIDIQEDEQFLHKIEETIKLETVKDDVYGVIAGMPPEFDTMEMLQNNIIYLKLADLEKEIF